MRCRGEVAPAPQVSSRGCFHDLELVAVGVLELEHRRDAWPAQYIAGLDTALAHGAVLRLGVGDHEPDAGISAGVRAGDQRHGRRGAWGGDGDPAEAVAETGVEPLLEAERSDEELDGLVLVADRDPNGPDVGDGGLIHGDSSY